MSSNEGQKQNSAQKKIHGSYYRVMVNLPVIIKEKDLIERKKTIDVFKKNNSTKQNQQIQGKSFQPNKRKDDQVEAVLFYLIVGKIFINQLWSEKFHKLVLKESKIQQVLERIQKLYRRNVEDFVDDIHKASEAKHKAGESILTKHLDQTDTQKQDNSSFPGDNSWISFPKIAAPQQGGVGLSMLHLNNLSNINNISNLQGNSGSPLHEQNTSEDEVREILPQISQLNKSATSPSLFKNPQKIFQIIEPIEQFDVESPSNAQFTQQKFGSSRPALKQRLKKEIKRHDLAKPRYNVMENTISPKLFNSTQRIIQQCTDLNSDWEKERLMQSQKIPFYVNKDDRY